jgi:hypothetical protein
MGKPMKNRILSIALALSLLASVFVALSTSAAVPYTGSVRTTDNLGATKELFFVGDYVYVNVELMADNVLISGSVTVSLVQTSDNTVVTHYHATTNDPDIGWNNGSHNGNGFGTWYGFVGDMMVYNVVVTYGGDEIARSSYTVKATGLTLSPPANAPPSPSYYPGEEITITYITTHTTDMFYTQVLNSTGATMINWTPQIAPSGYISWVWQIASDFPDGHFDMNVRDSTSHAIWTNKDIYVQKYRFEVSTDRTNYLVGENASIRYTVLDQASMTPFSNIEVSYSAHWFDSVGNGTWDNNTLVSSSGTHMFTVPANANISHDIDITYWANETGTSRSATATVWLSIEQLMGVVEVDSALYVPGDTVTATVTAMAGTSMLPDAAVDIAVEKNGTVIAAYGAAGLTTDQSGTAVHSFTLDAAAAQGTYVVNVTISKVGFSIVRETVFTVQWGGYLTLALDKAYYYGGDEVMMSFRTLWNNQEISTGSIAYKVTASFGIMVTGNTSTNEASFEIPQDYSGGLTILAQTNYNGYVLQVTVGTTVHLADLVLTADSATYKQGDTIRFHYEVVTSLSSVELSYSIVDNDGVEVAAGTPTSGSFAYIVPSEHASDSYDATVTLTTPSGAFVTASATVTIAPNYQLTIWVGKSGYASGQFKPGQELSIHYSIDTHSFAQLPVYQLVVYLTGDPSTHSFFVTAPQGSVQLKLPKEGSPAYTMIQVELRDPVADTHKSSSSSSIWVNSNLGAWDRSVGGMRAIDITLLVLVILIILLLIVVPFLKGRMGGPKAAKVVEPTQPAPPSP